MNAAQVETSPARTKRRRFMVKSPPPREFSEAGDTLDSIADVVASDSDQIRSDHDLSQSAFLIQAPAAGPGSSTDRCDHDLDLDQSWVRDVWSVMSEFLRGNLAAHSMIQYGSDCSGIDSPYWALEKLVGQLDSVPWPCHLL